jgi:prefoldin subunit 5
MPWQVEQEEDEVTLQELQSQGEQLRRHQEQLRQIAEELDDVAEELRNQSTGSRFRREARIKRSSST